MTPYNASDMLRAMDRDLGIDAVPDPTLAQTGESRFRQILATLFRRS